ncbi:hypothetical protein M1247_05820 [Mycobacterium sp. 21AC1]|uniref:hypothetical protein n=1 Tax=[Mycobacterium] appelbergii TaxID=2939269 RepID=UPI002938F41A|nr:hypothetical protein [Mycobacterium sp. 21AC1]MDV3124422.1 hypothetical protein [Mycobacterium sp. 21AC1]
MTDRGQNAGRPLPPRTYVGPPDRKRARLTGFGVLLALVLAVAALVIALISLGQEPAPSEQASAPAAPQTPAADADRALCQAIAPLMKENDDRSNAFLGSGEPGSPEQTAALPNFVTETQDWARRTQEVLDTHANPPRFMTRTLQRYLDDMQLFAASVRPGPGTQYDEAAWTDSIVAYGGPLSVCQALGVQW